MNLTVARSYFCIAISVALGTYFFLPLIINATFVWDDYRYLNVIRKLLTEDWWQLFQGMIVENRWDGNWWVAEGSAVRFFRPLVIVTFLADYLVWGLDARGFALTNLILHVVATIFVWECLRVVLDSRIVTLAATALFLLHPCHSENLHYISGRTDTIAGIFFFATLAQFLKLRRSGRGGTTPAILFCYFGALLGKEYNLLIPLCFYLYDRCLKTRLSGAYPQFAMVVVVYVTLRCLIMGYTAGSYPFPYFNLPSYPNFSDRMVGVLLQYLTGLISGSFIVSFLMSSKEFIERDGWIEILLAALISLSLLIPLVRFPISRWLVACFAVTFAPMLLLYSTGRYLYIPALFSTALLGMLCQHVISIRARSIKFPVLTFLILFCVLIPILRMRDQVEVLPKLQTQGSEDLLIPQLIKHVGVLSRREPLFLLDFPHSWIEMQFMQDAVEVKLQRTIAPIYVLSTYAYQSTELKLINDHNVALSRTSAGLYERNFPIDLLQRELKEQEIIKEQHYQVEIQSIDQNQVQSIGMTTIFAISTDHFLRFRSGVLEAL
jgi:hypothetical protein